MNRRLLFSAAAFIVSLFVAPVGTVQAADPIKVAASFSVLGDMVKQIGGDRVDVSTFVGPNGDAHVYEPTPGDAKTLAASAVLVVNGLGLEGWMGRLQKSSSFKGKLITATQGIKTRQMEEEEHGKTRKITDPHAWQSLANGRIYVANIRDALIAIDAAGKADYEANAAAYLAKLDALERDVRDTIARIPSERRRVVTSHDAFGYFESAYGIHFTAPQGVSTEAEASARDVAAIISAIRQQKAAAVFLENITDPRLVRQIASETGAKIGGVLYSDALTDATGDATTYIDLIRHNVGQLASALAS